MPRKVNELRDVMAALEVMEAQIPEIGSAQVYIRLFSDGSGAFAEDERDEDFFSFSSPEEAVAFCRAGIFDKIKLAHKNEGA